MDARQDGKVEMDDSKGGGPQILEEIIIEEIFVDGICGVYCDQKLAWAHCLCATQQRFDLNPWFRWVIDVLS